MHGADVHRRRFLEQTVTQLLVNVRWCACSLCFVSSAFFSQTSHTDNHLRSTSSRCRQRLLLWASTRISSTTGTNRRENSSKQLRPVQYDPVRATQKQLSGVRRASWTIHDVVERPVRVHQCNVTHDRRWCRTDVWLEIGGQVHYPSRTPETTRQTQFQRRVEQVCKALQAVAVRAPECVDRLGTVSCEQTWTPCENSSDV